MMPGKLGLARNLNRIGYLLLASMLLLLAMTLPAQARSLEMEGYLQNIVLHADGSIEVSETITVDFTGFWEGFNVNLPQNYNTAVTEFSVSENGQPYQQHFGSDYGPPGTFLVKETTEGVVVDWSIAAQDQTRTFVLSYRVLNAVTVYKDTAEFYRKFISENNQLEVSNVSVTLTLPPGAENFEPGKDILIFGHGPLQGTVDFSGPQQVVWQVDRLAANTFMEGRVLLPPQLFPQISPEMHSGQNDLNSILVEENNWAQQADAERNRARGEIAGGILLVLAGLLAVIYMWFKAGRRFPTVFNGDYYRELPADYSPAELAVLWNFGNPQTRDLTATLLDLARRQVLMISEETKEKRGLLGSKDITTYRISLKRPDLLGLTAAADNNDKTITLREHEQQLLKFLFQKVSKNHQSLYLYDIEVWAKKNGIAFHDFWINWQGTLERRGNQLGFFDDKADRYKWIGLASGLMLFGIFGTLIFWEKLIFLAVGAFVSGLILCVVPWFFNRRSPSGQEDMAKWQAFRRFLLDFSSMKHYEIPSLVIWEHYLVYATTLGVAREVIKQLEIVYPGLQENQRHFGYGWYSGHALGQMEFVKFNEVFEKSVATAQEKFQAANSSNSSIGGGGGFSGGGGGGSGGSSFGGR